MGQMGCRGLSVHSCSRNPKSIKHPTQRPPATPRSPLEGTSSDRFLRVSRWTLLSSLLLPSLPISPPLLGLVPPLLWWVHPASSLLSAHVLLTTLRDVSFCTCLCLLLSSLTDGHPQLPLVAALTFSWLDFLEERGLMVMVRTWAWGLNRADFVLS